MRSLLAVAFAVLLLAEPAFAGVGLSPVSVDFGRMLRSGYSERYFTVSNPSEEPQDVSVSVEGKIGSWITLKPATMTLEPHSYGVFGVVMQPPDDAANGGYSGSLMVIARPHTAAEIEGATGVSVASVVSASMSVEISDYQILQYKVEGISVPDTEECRPIIVTINIRNTGNVRVDPRFAITVTGEDGTVLQQHDETVDMLLPTHAAIVNIRVPYQLSQFGCIPKGKYRADITSYAGDAVMDRSTLSFSILARGQLEIKGEIVELIAPTNVTLGETVRIDAVFKNTGQLPLSVKPMIEVFSGPALVDTVSGDAVDIGLKGIDKLTAYWKPGVPGKYTLRATASFEGHSSAPVEREIEVNAPTWWMLAGIAVGGAIVAAAFFLLRRGSRRTQKRKKR